MSDYKTLKEVCELLNVTRRIVQGYEKKGLVHTDFKDKYGHLLYDETAVKRITMIRFYQKMGFELKEIASLLDCSKNKLVKQLNRQLDTIRQEIETRDKDLKLMENIVEKMDQEDPYDELIEIVRR